MAALTDKIALVTGASRGLGYAVAQKLAAEGAHVIALARTVGGLEELDDAITAAGGACTLTPLDITDDAGLERLGAAIHGRWGKLDLLVHCAAQDAPLSPAEHASDKDFDKAMKVNARATQRLIRIADPLLKAAEHAQAVFIDDTSSAGEKFNASYGASKAASRAVVQSYAAETQRTGALVWLANPPAMPTAIRGRAHPGEDQAALTPCETVAKAITRHIIARDIGAGDTATL